MADPRITITVDYDGDPLDERGAEVLHEIVEDVMCSKDDVDGDSLQIDVQGSSESDDTSHDDHHY